MVFLKLERSCSFPFFLKRGKEGEREGKREKKKRRVRERGEKMYYFFFGEIELLSNEM
jgi:hypothetical protein